MKETRRFPRLAKEMVDRQKAAAMGPPAPAVPTCERCGCTDDCACEEGCGWIRPGLCSSCATIEELEAAGLGPMII